VIVMKSKVLFYFIIIFLPVSGIFAQMGPGGIGNADGDSGQPKLLFWLNADSLSLSDNDNVNVWNDLSGNNYDFSQTQSSEQPVFNTSSINGHSAIEFDGSDMSLIDEDGGSYFNGLGGLSFFAVIQSDNTDTDAGFFDTEDPDGGDDLFALRYDDSGANGGENDVLKIGIHTDNGEVQIESSANIQTISPQLVSAQWLGGESLKLFVDGGVDVLSDDGGAVSGITTNSTKLIVGKGPKDAGGSWDGKIAEVFLFAEALNSASRNVLENYISQKYSISISSDYYSGGDPAWVHNISGLGKESDGAQNQAYSAGLNLYEDGSFDNGDYLFLGHNNVVNDEANIRYGADITSSGAEAAWNRDWYVEKTGNLNSQFVFNIAEGFENGNHPHSPDDYVLLYRSGTSGAYSQLITASSINGPEVLFSVADVDLQNGYYTLGTLDQTENPVQGQPGKIWYSLVSGDWDNWEVWTLDPSGALPDNPSHLIPSVSNSDKVVILNGRTVDVTSDDLSNASIQVSGRLDLNATSGHYFGEISGNGRILMQADNFPSGDASGFNSKGNGTVEFYGSGYDLTKTRTFNDVVLEMDNPSAKLILETDYTIVGNLTIKTGDLQLNDNANTTPLVLDVEGDVNVHANGKVSVGTADAYNSSLQSGYGNYHKGFHQFKVGGDFENNGEVRLTNLVSPDYNSRAINGAVSLVFYGAANKQFLCNNTTDVYNLVLDKGNDRTYELELYADDKAYFALFGENDEQWDDTDAAHPENRKALWIKNGTLRLTGSVFIPSLTEGSRDYKIGRRAGLVLDGADVYVQNSADENSDFSGMSHGEPDGINTGGSQQALYPYGKLHIVNGYWYLGKGEAINFRDEAPGIIQVDGGVLEANQIAISSSASSGNFSFIINGGEVRVTDEYGSDESRALLNLDNADMTFAMTGGALYVNGTSGHDPNGIHIASSTGNYNVSGGTVYINSGVNTEVLSTAPFYNLVINGGSSLTLQEPLTVLNDLEIQSNATLAANGHDVSVGGDFDLNDNGAYTHGGNTTRFIGNGRSNVYIRNTDIEHDLTFYNLELTKDQRYNSSLFHRVEIISNGRNAALSPVLIQNDLIITRGEFDVDEYLVDIEGDVEIVDGQIIASSGSPGRLVLSGASQIQTLKGAVNSFSLFGNLELYNEFGLQVLTTISVDDLYLTPRNGKSVVDLGVNRLEVSGSISTSGSYSSDVMIQTAGNAGDGGLSFLLDLSSGSAGSQTLLPVGTVGKYNPVTVTQVASIEDQGKIIVKPVGNDHPSSTKPDKTIPFYWVVDTVGFSSLTDNQLKYTFTFNSGSIPGGANKLLHLSTNDFLWTEHPKNITGSAINFPYEADLTGDYTVGNHSDFKDPVVYYSTTVDAGNDTDFGTGDNWNNSSRWSTLGHYSNVNTENSYPQEGDVAILGFGLDNASDVTDNNQRSHWFFVNSDVNVARLIFADEVVNQDGVVVPRETSFLPQLVIDDNSGIDVNFGVISGSGTFNVQVGCSSCDSNPDISVPRLANIEGDFGEFINNEDSRFDYDLYTSNNSAVFLPKSFPEIYPNVHVKGQNGTNRTLIFDEDILIKGDLTIREDAVLLLSDKLEGDIEVLGDLLFTVNNGSDKLEFPGAGYERTFTLYGDVVMTDGKGDRISVRNDNPSGLTHLFRLGGSIFKESDNYIDFFSDNSGGNNVILEVFGESSAEFQSDNNPMELYRIVMNKMEGRSFDFQDSFTLNGPADGDTKALELISGRLQLRDPGIDITLSSGGADFRIPAEAELNTGLQSTVRVTGDNTGIWLDGRINVGWDTYWYINGGVNNYIEYTASGNSTIDVFQGHLYVGSQIRRNPATEEGILHFNQKDANSEIVIGTNADQGGELSRGMLELLNTSTLTQVDGAEITIANSVPNSSVPSFYLDVADDKVNLGANSILAFGNNDTGADQTLGIYSSSKLVDVHVSNASGNDPELVMKTVPVELESLTVESSATFNANGLDLTINGDFTNSGDFVAGGNATFFTGLTDQTITGNTTFWDLQKDGSANLALASGATEIIVDNEMTLNAGVFADNSNTVYVSGDLHFDGTHQYGGAGKGLVLSGTSSQVLSGNGVFGKLTINNTTGVHVPIGNELTITNSLRMERGVFNIDRNLLLLGGNCEIEEVSGIAPFSASKMIQTNMSFTDNGIKKIFASGVSSFVFPMGSTGKYTPVTFDVSENTATEGSLTVKPANEMHTSVTDPNNVLQYHWLLRADGLTGFTATARMKYVESDVEVEAPNTIYEYWTARLLSDGSGDWNKFSGSDVIDETNQELVFDFTTTNDAGISGDYTAGLEVAIPDQVPGYITITNGNWTDETIWDTYPVSGGTVPAGGPRGSMVFVDHDVTLPSNYISSYRTTINNTGEVIVGQTFGHRFGEVSGSGILKLESGNLPAGIYDEFLLSGTFEFAGTGNYDVLSSFSAVNNLIFSGSGERRLANIDLQINGDVLLAGANLINEHNKTISLKGDFEFNSGAFDSGMDGDASWVFNGGAFQAITGPANFSGANAFYNFEVNNSSGLGVETDTEIDNNLALTSGVINNTLGNRFVVLNSSSAAVTGGSASAYVSGPFGKRISNGGTFNFPVGDAGRYGELLISDTQTGSASLWEVTYNDDNPLDGGLDPDSYSLPIQFVSKNEYWQIRGVDGSSAHVTVRWDSQSGVSADAGERDELRLVSWNDLTPDDAWEEAGRTITDGGQNTGTIKSNTVQSFNEFAEGNYFTIGGVLVYNYSWKGDTPDWFLGANWVDGNVPSISTAVTIPESPSGGNHPVIDGDAYCKDLGIEPNATVTLNAGATLNIVNSFVNNGDVILKSTPNAVASLNVPVGNTDSGHGIIELSDVMAGQWYRFGQPVSNPTGAIYDASVGTSWVYRSTTSWQRITSDANAIDPMEGIMVLYQGDHTIDYEGALNTGNMSWTIPYGKGYYLFANPYPSSINWDIDDVEDTGVTISDNLSSTIYYRIYAGTQVGDYLLTYNGFTGVSAIEAGGSFPSGYTAQNMGNISPLQSVWVKVNATPAGNATIDLTNKARIADNSLPLKSASASSSDRYILRLMQTNAYISDVAVICFSNRFGAGMERADSEKMFNTSKKVPEIYTRVDDKSLVINGLPALTGESYSMPVSVKNQELAEVELSIRLDEFTNNYDVLIEDKVTGVWTDFRKVQSYLYMPQETGNVHDRFVLHLNPVMQVPTDVVEFDNAKNGGIQIEGRELYALVTISQDLLNGNAANIDLMDIHGRLISSQTTKETETEIQLPDATGVYLIKVTAGTQLKTAKIMRK
jgi:hypothetical protein